MNGSWHGVQSISFPECLHQGPSHPGQVYVLPVLSAAPASCSSQAPILSLTQQGPHLCETEKSSVWVVIIGTFWGYCLWWVILTWNHSSGDSDEGKPIVQLRIGISLNKLNVSTSYGRCILIRTHRRGGPIILRDLPLELGELSPAPFPGLSSWVTFPF